MLERLFIPSDPGSTNMDVNSPLFKFFRNPDYMTSEIQATENNATNFDTVYACVNVLSDDIAKLPFKTYKKDNETGSIHEIKDNDVYRVIRIRPNSYMTPFNFVKLMMTDVLINGNAYALIVRNKSGEIEELLPLTAGETHPLIHEGNLYYQTNINGELTYLHSDEVVHLKGMSLDGLTGLSPIQTIRVQLESNEQASRYNRDLIQKGAVPQGILEVDTALNSDAKEKLRESWQRANSGENIAVADQGIKYKQLGLSQSDMQWLESQKYNAQRIASIFKVPLHKINDLENATYTNIEHQSLDYVKNTLQPWITQIEYEFGYKFYTSREAEQGYYLKFNMDSELRGDSHARARVNEINLRNGFKTVNEIRGSNEDSPYQSEIADKPFMTLNHAPMERINDFNNNHFGKSLNKDDDVEEVENDDDEQQG